MKRCKYNKPRMNKKRCGGGDAGMSDVGDFNNH